MMMLTQKEICAFVDFEKSGWESAADAYHDHWGMLSAQSASSMLNSAGADAGAKVLDVATGAGYVAAAAAERGASAVGLDFSAAQVELARSVYPDVRFLQGDAQELPFEDETFDAVVMGFGMNHLPDPDQACREAWRVLKPGGRFAFTVWASPRPNEGFGIVLGAIERHGVDNPDLPPAPPYFRFADETQVQDVLGTAGFSNISTEVVPQVWRHASSDQLFDAFNRGAVRATAMLQSQPAHVRALIREETCAAVEGLAVGQVFEIPVPAALSVGTK